MVILTLAIRVSGQQPDKCEIEFNFKNHTDNYISLAYHLGDRQYIRDTVHTDSKGKAVYSNDIPLEKGLYMVVFPDNSLFEIIISDDQEFGVSCDRNDIMNTLEFIGSEENTAFLAYRKKWMNFQEEASRIQQKLGRLSDADSINILTGELAKLEGDILSYIRNTAKKYDGSLLASMLYSMLPVEVPAFEIPSDIANRDSIRWLMGYKYNKDHFFDNTDLSDPRLIRTPILYNKLNTFFTNVIIQAPDSIMPEIRSVVERAEKNEETFRYVISYLFNHFRESQIMGHDAIVVMLADEYYLNGKADWVGNEFLNNLRRDVASIRPSLIGKKATDFTMETYAGVPRSLYDIDSDFTILYFWEPNCGHCKTVTPQLKTFYDQHRDEGIEVFAVCTQDNRDEWEAYIAEHGLEWINGWDPTRSTAYDFYYNVRATPMIYILNKNKEIIAKKLPVENIGDFIDAYRRIHR